MRFKVNDVWYTHELANSMMVEMTMQERDQLLGMQPVRDENGNAVIRMASFINDAATWAPENKQAWIDNKPIPQPGIVSLKPVAPDERTKWEREQIAKGLPIK